MFHNPAFTNTNNNYSFSDDTQYIKWHCNNNDDGLIIQKLYTFLNDDKKILWKKNNQDGKILEKLVDYVYYSENKYNTQQIQNILDYLQPFEPTNFTQFNSQNELNCQYIQNIWEHPLLFSDKEKTDEYWTDFINNILSDNNKDFLGFEII
ncbi:hypothetical protein BMW23_0769 [Bodo saltans virus]|uniref:Uncharacterized protein n=1 Tax=Bodo saltans virus TaxID=2024608 RepID=A0A2H4UVF9_9VIRU|nr:hypothetical protein QJ851_gp0752 [Bodo saltans virus]ATZ80815.1 hypothetical protein BMW23_0769 [Bodo saltans virus]